MSISASLSIGGTYSVSATFVDDISDAAVAPSCADAAKGFHQDGQRYVLPQPPRSASYNGHVVGIQIVIPNYSGPNGYDNPSIAGADGTATLIDIDGAGWAAANGGTVHIDVKADDSGRVVFEKLQPTPATPPPTVSGQPAPPAPPARVGSITGTLSWTCSAVRATPVPTPRPSARPAPAQPGKPAATPTAPH